MMQDLASITGAPPACSSVEGWASFCLPGRRLEAGDKGDAAAWGNELCKGITDQSL